MARLVGPVLLIAACIGIWYLRSELTLLRGTILWEIRFVLLAAAAILTLSLGEWLARKLGGTAE